VSHIPIRLSGCIISMVSLCVSQAQVEAKKEHEGAVHLLEVSDRPVVVLVGGGGGEGHLGLRCACVGEAGANLRPF